MYKETFKMVDGDVVFKNNDLYLVSGQEELRQNIENRLSVNLREWFLNIKMGLDYAAITGKGVQDRMIDFAIRECCLQDERVKSVFVNSIKRNNETRQAIIDITIIDKGEDKIYLKEVVALG